jgi:hypothetical protein
MDPNDRSDEVVNVSNSFIHVSRPPTARVKSFRSRQPADAPIKVVGDMKSESEGIFWFEESHTVLDEGKRVHRGISTRELQQLKELVKSGVFTEHVMRTVVIPLNDENSEAPRLRAYDWAVTNYSKGHPKSMLLQGMGGAAAIVDPNLSYEGELRKHHRLLFDPFRRGTHIFFDIDGVIHRTTVGQLTFIKWCIENSVDKYVEANLTEIRAHMASATKRDGSGKKRRRELTRAPTTLVRGVLMTSYDIMTDTAAEIQASKDANQNARVSELAREIAAEEGDDIEKARALASII